jgi:hypothetical protein
MFEISRRKNFSYTALLSLIFPILFSLSCGSLTPSVSDPTGQQAILDIANNDLTNSDCGDALSTILPLYNSTYSNNQVRLITASAYGCDAEINFFQVVTNLGLDANTLSTASLFGYLAQIFPSTTADKVVESAGYGMEVLLTTLTTGEVIAPASLINSTSDNPGSLLYSDRIADSNLYMLMMSMATMGGAASRLGNKTTFHPLSSTSPFPWTDNTVSMTTEGCTVAAATQNFLDVLAAEALVLSGSASAALQQVEGYISTSSLDAACEAGCKGTALPLPNWKSSGCTLSTCGNGGHCPAAIRDWNQCKPNVANDPIACASAGVINLLNTGAVWF